MFRPLEGIRVVDFGWVWAGAVPGHILADMGAEVIKVESLTRLDYMRQGKPIVGTEKDPEQNPMFQNVNRGKLSLRINMTTPDGAAILRDLVSISDVVIENFAPGTLDKYGLGWAELEKVQPNLIMCSMSAVGQQGPLRDIRTYATMIAGLAGIDSMVGYPDDRVLGTQSSYADPNASLHGAFAVLAGLWSRRQNERGTYIDLSQWEAAANLMGEQILGYILNQRTPGTVGTDHSYKAPYGNYPAAGDDQWISIAVEADEQWSALGQVLGEPTWMSEPQFASAYRRWQNRVELDTNLVKDTQEHDAYTLAQSLWSNGVPAAPVLSASEVAEHEHFKQRQLFQEVDHPVLGKVPVYGLPWQIDGKVWQVTTRAPLLGEHNDYVLRTLLQLPDKKIEELQEAGVFD